MYVKLDVHKYCTLHNYLDIDSSREKACSEQYSQNLNQNQINITHKDTLFI